MLYVIEDLEEKKVAIYQDSTQVADILGVSRQTIWNNSKKNTYEKGKYRLYYNREGVIKSKRGRKKGVLYI